jgi:hypothetical protein
MPLKFELERLEMKSNNFQLVKLEKGSMQIYDLGRIKLHAYQTNNPMNDELFVFEKHGKAVVFEAPLFYDNIKELGEYINSLNVIVEGLMLSYHLAGGASFLPGVKRYSSKKAYESASKGQVKDLIEDFVVAFGNKIDKKVNTIANYIDTDSALTIAGIKMAFTETDEGFDIGVPEINTIYMHMLGHDAHSIVAGDIAVDKFIAQLDYYLSEGYDLILSSHHIPESKKDVKTKIAYLENLKRIAAKSASQEQFKILIKKKYSEYIGDTYLDMTAKFFFPN